MTDRMYATIGLAICVASAVLMLTGVLNVEIGLVVGTAGMLILATRPSRHNDQEHAE